MRPNLGAHATKDFVYYNLLRAWKGKDTDFPFIDSHAKNYNVRDGSDWERTLKPRIRDRLKNSKNIVLFLSSVTKNSRALREEATFGIDSNALPIIVVYPDYTEKSDIIVVLDGQSPPKGQEPLGQAPRLSRSNAQGPDHPCAQQEDADQEGVAGSRLHGEHSSHARCLLLQVLERSFNRETDELGDHR